MQPPSPPPPPIPSLFGSHLSIAGSMCNALREAETLGLDCVQVFTKNQQQWKAPPLKEEAVTEWKAELKRLGWIGTDRVTSHASYLANMASVNETLRRDSIALMREEIERCETLGIPLLVFHPGAFTTSTLEEGITRIVDACGQLLRDTRGYRTVLCLENVAGQGSSIGRRFEELATLRQRIAAGSDEHRIGFCIDTCHAHAAGYDCGTRDAAERTIDELDNVIGIKHVRCLHVNDSKPAMGSRVDRHEHIGDGTIGLGGFAAFVNRAEFADRPKIMETPKGDTKGVAWDTINVARLRGLIGSTARTFPAPERIEPLVLKKPKAAPSKEPKATKPPARPSPSKTKPKPRKAATKRRG